jgi:pimeloyl-ACP methyl ester carboxylesterase
MWGELRGCQLPMLLVAGQLDAKFAGIKRRMFARLRQGLVTAAAEPGAAAAEEQGLELSAAELGAELLQQQQQQQQQQKQGQPVGGAGIMHQWAEVPGAGHAVHVEAPLQLLQLFRGFVQQLQEP